MKNFKPEAGMGIMAIVVPVIMGIFFVIFGISFGVLSTSNGAPFIFGIAGGFFALIGVCVVVTSILAGLKMKKNIQSGAYGEDMETDSFDESFGHKLRSGTTVTIKDFDRDTKTDDDIPDEVPEYSEDTKGSSDTLFKAGFCTSCGTTAEKDFNFCPKCGKNI